MKCARDLNWQIESEKGLEDKMSKKAAEHHIKAKAPGSLQKEGVSHA